MNLLKPSIFTSGPSNSQGGSVFPPDNVSTLRGSYGKCKRPGLDQGAPSGPRFFHSVGNSFGSFAGVVLPARRARFLRYGYGLTWLKIMVKKNKIPQCQTFNSNTYVRSTRKFLGPFCSRWGFCNVLHFRWEYRPR